MIDYLLTWGFGIRDLGWGWMTAAMACDLRFEVDRFSGKPSLGLPVLSWPKKTLRDFISDFLPKK